MKIPGKSLHNLQRFQLKIWGKIIRIRMCRLSEILKTVEKLVVF